MFQFRRFPTYDYGFIIRYAGMTPRGFPHSEMYGSPIICISPYLFAAYHVFLRLSVPRHSPCALISLTVFLRPIHDHPAHLAVCFAFMDRPSILHLPTRSLCAIVVFLQLYSKSHFAEFCLYSVFKVPELHLPRANEVRTISLCEIVPRDCITRTYCYFPWSLSRSFAPSRGEDGGLKWIRTIDLALIRRAL